MSRNREFSDPFCDGECYIRSFGIKTVGMLASLAMLVGQVSEAQALLSSPIRALPRSAEAALRRSIPAFNKDVYQVQMELEEVQYQLRIPQRKPWKDMADHVATAAALIKMDSVLQGVLPGDMTTAKDIVTYIDQDVTKLMTAIQLKDADRTSIRVANALERISNLELLQVPGLPYPIPKQYQHLPRLNGRAVVQLALKKSNGANGFYNPDGLETVDTVIEITLDGYSAPLTAGNFAYNVIHKIYDGMILHVDGTSILGVAGGNQGSEVSEHRELPLEILAKGDFEPTYRSPLDVQGGEIPVLPLSLNGAVSMTKSEKPGIVSDKDFFIYKYQRQQSGLAGLSFDEGQFPVFGYVTQGGRNLSRIEEGDIVTKAVLLSGKDKLGNEG